MQCLVQELNLRVLRTVGLESTALTTRPTRQMGRLHFKFEMYPKELANIQNCILQNLNGD